MRCSTSMDVAGSLSPRAAERSTGNNARLVSAAHEFEASMLSELLKPLQHGAAAGEDSAADGAESSLQDFASAALGKAISERGGFGIAKRILEHFEASAGKTEPGKKSQN